MMKNLLKLEEIMLFVLSIFLFAKLEYAWWWYPLLLFAPDISMVGYLGGTRLGAVIYNIIHHRVLSIGIYIMGSILAIQPLQLAGLILFGHSSLDRVLGYGLKYSDLFQNTHLGVMGKSNQVGK